MLNNSLKFLKFLRDFEKIERSVYRPDGIKENDVEHSYQLAMMSWFLANQFGLSLSKEKLLTYGLVHDLIEVYSGDTPVYAVKDQLNTIETKKEREEQAFVQIKKDFRDFDEMLEAIEMYEQKQDEESVFVYEVDKLIPALNLYLDGGYGWNKLGITLEQIKKEKRSKIQSTKHLIDLLEQTLSRFEKEEHLLFEKK